MLRWDMGDIMNVNDEPAELIVFRAKTADTPPEVKDLPVRIQELAKVAREAQRSRPGSPIRLGTHRLSAAMGMNKNGFVSVSRDIRTLVRYGVLKVVTHGGRPKGWRGRAGTYRYLGKL
jgi:hypothetical protein